MKHLRPAELTRENRACLNNSLSTCLQQLTQSCVPLHALSDVDVANPIREGGWSRRQELGHLIDSAANNHVRFVVAALEGRYSGPTYDADAWVDLHGYAGMDWTDLVDLWYSMNL